MTAPAATAALALTTAEAAAFTAVVALATKGARPLIARSSARAVGVTPTGRPAGFAAGATALARSKPTAAVEGPTLTGTGSREPSGAPSAQLARTALARLVRLAALARVAGSAGAAVFALVATKAAAAPLVPSPGPVALDGARTLLALTFHGRLRLRAGTSVARPLAPSRRVRLTRPLALPRAPFATVATVARPPVGPSGPSAAFAPARAAVGMTRSAGPGRLSTLADAVPAAKTAAALVFGALGNAFELARAHRTALGERRVRRCEQALDDERRVCAAGQLKTHFEAPSAALFRVRFRRPHPQVLGSHDQRTALGLEGKPVDVADAHLVRHEPFFGERVLEQIAFGVAQFLLEPVRRQREVVDSRECTRPRAGGTHERTLERIDDEPLFHRQSVAQECRHRAVPKVRLPREQMDQPHTLADEPKRTREVAGRFDEVLEHRAVFAGSTGEFQARLPIAPALGETTLKAAKLGVRLPVALGPRRCGEDRAQRSVEPPRKEVADDPALVVAQVAKALVVEVVGHAVFAHSVDVRAQDFNVLAVEAARADLECVAEAVPARQRFVRKSDGLDAQLGPLEAHHVTARQAHVLDRDALTVLEARDRNVGGCETRLAREHRGGLGCRQLALGDAVNAVGAGALQEALFEQFAHAEVADAVFEFHRWWGLHLESCLRVRWKSAGSGALTCANLPSARGPFGVPSGCGPGTNAAPSSAGRGNTIWLACRASRSSRARSGRPRLAR